MFNRHTMLVVAIAAFVSGALFTPLQAAGATAFLERVDKSIKISGQMASGKVPYNPVRAVKEMVNIQKAVQEFQSDGQAGAPTNVVSCAAKLKAASLKGAAAAKAGVGAFKAVYGDLLTSYKSCQK